MTHKRHCTFPASGECICRSLCILNPDSPSYPTRREFERCGCDLCVKELVRLQRSRTCEICGAATKSLSLVRCDAHLQSADSWTRESER